MKKSSFWEKESFNQSWDLIVIGAGITGLSSALFYRQRHPGAHILVVDKGAIPEGASTRNAGFACLGSITEHGADMERETEENIEDHLQRRYRGLQLLRDTLGDEAIGYENSGGYEVFTARGEFARAEKQIRRFNSWMEALVGEKQVYRPGEMNGYPVIRNRLDGALHPGKMMQALIKKVQEANIAIRWNTPVEDTDSSGTIRLKNGGEMESVQLLIACNGFTKRLVPESQVEPARGLVMVSEPWESIPWRGTFSYDRGYVYFRSIGDRLLLGGGRNVAMETESTDQFGINPAVKEYLHKFARQILQMPAEIGFEHEWSGIMGFTPTKTPELKRLDTRRVVAGGLSGMGIAIGMDVGRTVATILRNNS